MYKAMMLHVSAYDRPQVYLAGRSVVYSGSD